MTERSTKSEFLSLHNNQDWPCEKQRSALALQEWLETGEALNWFPLPGNGYWGVSDSPIFESRQKYFVRYWEEAWWILWQEEELYHHLGLYSQPGVNMLGKTTPPPFGLSKNLVSAREAIKEVLITIRHTNKLPTSLNDDDVEKRERIIFTEKVSVEAKDEEKLIFTSTTRHYEIGLDSLLTWHKNQ